MDHRFTISLILRRNIRSILETTTKENQHLTVNTLFNSTRVSKKHTVTFALPLNRRQFLQKLRITNTRMFQPYNLSFVAKVINIKTFQTTRKFNYANNLGCLENHIGPKFPRQLEAYSPKHRLNDSLRKELT